MSPEHLNGKARNMRTQTLADLIEQEKDAVVRNALLRQLMARRKAKPYLNRLLRSADVDIKLALIALLEPKAARGLSDALIEALKDPDVSVRIAALDALARLGEKRAVHEVLQCLESRYESVRLSAVSALVQLGDPGSASDLAKSLRDEAVAVRLRVLHALAALKAKSSGRDILALANDSHPFVREAAVRALGLLGNKQIVPDLLRIARTRQDAQLRCAAIEAISRFNDPQIASQLIAALQDANLEVRCAAAEALAQRKECDAIPPLIAAAEQESDPSAKRHIRACCSAIEQTPPPGQRREPSKEKQNPLWRNWYSNPSLDAGSLIYTFRSNGTGYVEDFAMGITRKRAVFRYRIIEERIAFNFSDRRGKKEVRYIIRRSTYRDPLEGPRPCQRLEFAQEPYFKRRGPGRSFYYNLLYERQV